VVEISSFYNGNQFLAMYYEVYRDIRLVGTPPESVGKFGGETDNWRWPRHTCDFSMFRIYANGSNKPADFNPANKPFSPAHHLPINIGGMQEGDYAMIMGYPGRTTRYTYSEGIKYLASKERPMRVQLRRDIMDVYENYMKQDESVRLMYSDRLAGIGNYWNKFNGEANDLSKPNGLYETRKNAELAFERWVRENKKTDVYGDVTSLYDEAYRELYTYGLYPVYLQDGISNSQPMSFAMSFKGLADALKANPKDTAMSRAMLRGIDEMYKEFYPTIEKEVLAVVLKHIYEDLDPSMLPADLNAMVLKYKKNYTAVAEAIFAKSIFTNKERMAKFLGKPSASKLEGDVLYKITQGYLNKLRVDLKPVYDGINSKLDRANRLFLSAQMEMLPSGQTMAPDANGTMRLTYGTVKAYDARDAVSYAYFTTAKGILEKYKAADFEFDAPQPLLALIRAKDYGQYADKDGELHTCFLSDNDITGGNSGSPVMNAKGELIGTAFDGNWEAISSDFAFLPKVQRTISLDVRYTLFIVEKLGGAKHLINEMTIVK
jgi:septum formation topological specificity factor MinE